MKLGTLWIALVVLCAWGVAGCGGGHHHVTPITTKNFVFYAAGTDSADCTYYIAGVVQISADGNNTIMGGVQDFNDGDPEVCIGTSPQPSGDTINPVGSSLSFNPDGSGNALLTLSLIHISVYSREDKCLTVQLVPAHPVSLGLFAMRRVCATPTWAPVQPCRDCLMLVTPFRNIEHTSACYWGFSSHSSAPCHAQPSQATQC